MPVFTYRAKDGSGNTVDGRLDADDLRAATDKVRELGYWPLDIRTDGPAAAPQAGKKTKGSVNPLWTGVSTRSQAIFFRQLATMLTSGMYLSEALDNLGQQRGIGRLAAIARQGADHVRDGGMFSEVMAAYPRIFSRVQMGLIETGERGGLLDKMVGKIADYTERDQKLRQKFARITFYPKLIVVFVVLVVTFLPYVPLIVNSGLPVVMTITRSHLVPIVLELFAAWIIIKLLLTLPPIRCAWDASKLHFPVLGGVTHKLAMSRFASTLSVLYAAGLPIGQGVDLSIDSLGNACLSRKIRYAVPELRAGGQLSEALRRAGGVPDMVLGMIATGERTGSIDSVLEKVSEYYTEESETSIEKLGYLLFVLLIIICAGVVGTIVVRFYMGYFNGILNSAGG